MRLYLVRHGETNNNAEKRHQDGADELSEKGAAQTRALGQRFLNIPLDAIITSPYKRTFATAESIAAVKKLPVETNELLVEYRWPSRFTNEKRNDPRIADERAKIEQAWESNPDWTDKDGESFASLKRRITTFLDAVQSRPEKNIAVVSHARFLKVLLAVIVHGPAVSGKHALDMVHGIALSNTGITVVEKGSSRLEVVIINDHAHLGEYQNQLRAL